MPAIVAVADGAPAAADAATSTAEPVAEQPPVSSQTVDHFIVLQHGIDGSSSDLNAVADALSLMGASSSPSHKVEVFNSDVNKGGKTHSGIFKCAARLWAQLQLELDRLVPSAQCNYEKGWSGSGSNGSKLDAPAPPSPPPPPPLRVSFVGHSMGGLILREVSLLLAESSKYASSVELDTLVLIASPHLGCRLLGNGGAGGVAPLMGAFGPSLMRAGLRFVKGETGPQLLLDDGALETLTDERHCKILRRFRRRLLYVNGSGDWLVNFESSALLTPDEMAAILPPSLAACSASDGPVLWRPSEAELSTAAKVEGADHGNATSSPTTTTLPPSLALSPTSRALVLKPLDASAWDEKHATATAKTHRTWDDRKGWRARRAASILSSLRSVGEYELHVCHFLRRSSFAGGVFSPHIDLVLHPKCTQTHGKAVVDHLAANVVLGGGGKDGGASDKWI